MQYRKDAEKLLAALATLVEDPRIALDEKGCCLAELNGIVFAFSFDEKQQCLYIQSHAGSLNKAADPTLMLEWLLEANHLWQGTAGGVLGLDRNGELGLAYRLDFPLPEEDFPETLLCELMPLLVGVTEWCRDCVTPGNGRNAA